jgi:hypothetical protein
VTKKNSVFWDVSPYGFIRNDVSEERVGSIFRAELTTLATKSQLVSNRLTLFLVRVICSTLKMEATRSSETSVYNKPTRRHIPEDEILQNFNSVKQMSTSPLDTILSQFNPLPILITNGGGECSLSLPCLLTP